MQGNASERNGEHTRDFSVKYPQIFVLLDRLVPTSYDNWHLTHGPSVLERYDASYKDEETSKTIVLNKEGNTSLSTNKIIGNKARSLGWYMSLLL
jgi:hypothetical protein